jgi:hypothetical protein
MAEHLVNDVLPNKFHRSADEQELLDRYGDAKKAWWNSLRRERGMKVQDMSFTELSQIVAYGDVAYGKGLTCPRDGLHDCSIVDAVLANGHSQEATLFLSSDWDCTLATASSALENYLVNHPVIRGEDCFLWWRFFSDNLFRPTGPGSKANESFEELRWAFGNQLRSVGHMAIIADQLVNPRYCRRSWCVFEACVAVEEQIPIEVLLPESAGTEVDSLLQKGGFKNLEASLEIDAEKATSFSKEDEQGIKRFITKRPGGYAKLNASLSSSMKKSVQVEMCKSLGIFPTLCTVRSTLSI